MSLLRHFRAGNNQPRMVYGFLQFFYLNPVSLLVDIIRLAVLTRPTGYGLLVLMQVLEMITKVHASLRGCPRIEVDGGVACPARNARD